MAKYKLGDIVTLLNGRAYLMPELQDSGKYRILRVGNLSGGNDSWYYSDMELDENKYCENGDLLYAWACNFGPHIWREEKVIYHYHIWKLVENKEKVDRTYLYYYLLHQTPFYLGGVNGATMVHITKKNMEKKTVYIPSSLNVQHRIASILSTYDSLIENNTKRIRLLEKMVENLYKEWFVRFRFPGHENVEMENGLPKGWKVKKYEDEFNVKYGKGLPTDKLTKDGFPVFGSNGQIGYYTSYMYETPQILISCRGASSGVVNISLPKSFITNNSLICEMTNKTESVFEYLKYCFLNTNLVQYQTGSAQPQITINNIVKLKLLIPSTDVQIKFADKVRILDKEVGNLQHQNSLLARQRDLLLPRLMSGKLEVKEELLE